MSKQTGSASDTSIHQVAKVKKKSKLIKIAAVIWLF